MRLNSASPLAGAPRPPCPIYASANGRKWNREAAIDTVVLWRASGAADRMRTRSRFVRVTRGSTLDTPRSILRCMLSSSRQKMLAGDSGAFVSRSHPGNGGTGEAPGHSERQIERTTCPNQDNVASVLATSQAQTQRRDYKERSRACALLPVVRWKQTGVKSTSSVSPVQLDAAFSLRTSKVDYHLANSPRFPANNDFRLQATCCSFCGRVRLRHPGRTSARGRWNTCLRLELCERKNRYLRHAGLRRMGIFQLQEPDSLRVR